MAKSDGSAEEKSFSDPNKPYVSCIRIHGLRILPPILTDEKRRRMQYFKELAVKVENKIKNRKLDKLTSDDCESATYVDSNSSISDSVNYSSDEEPTFKSQIFSESCRSDVLKMLNDSPKTAITNVPLKNSDSDTNKCLNELPEKITPRRNSDSKKIFSVDTVGNSSILCEKDFSHQGAGDNIINGHLDENKNEENSDKSSPPLLIRSNSYTLDAPSPFLIAYMKQNNNYTPDPKTNDNNNKKRRTWDLDKAREKWSSIEHDLNIVSFNRKNENFNSLPPSSNASPEVKMFESRVENIKRSDSVQLPEKDIPISENFKQIRKICTAPPKMSDSRFIKSFVTPLRMQNPEKDVKILEKSEPKKIVKKTDLIVRKPALQKHRTITIANNQIHKIILPKKPDILSCEKTENQIREIIDQIHSEQSKQMSDLIARQKKEQESLMMFFAEQQTIVLSKLRSTYETKEDATKTRTELPLSTVPEPDIIKNSENLLFECKKLLQEDNSSQSLVTIDLSSPEDTLISKSCSPSPKNLSSNLIVESVSSSSRFSNSFSLDSLEAVSKGNSSRINILRTACSRQLFPTKQQIWAATKLNAGVRGYLVRRLIKTDRVQNLIKTIRDTLLCAMQLHHETTDKIQPADVELHRRLIQQVTAACYSFHDTFFEFSKPEQMLIIALDRERQKDKLLRPVSSKSNTSLSSTTQKVLERKLRRRSSDSASGAPSRCSSSRSCYSAGEFRVRTKSLGLSDSVQSNRKTSPQNEVMRRAMSYGANKKPWR